MEGGITVKSQYMLKSHRYLYLITLLIIASALTIASLSYSQPGNKANREISFYKMTGPLQVFSLEEKQARIDDLEWDLADDFRTKDVPREWKKKGTVEFTEREVWVYYYVRLSTMKEKSPGAKKGTYKKKIQVITNPDEIQKIREMGGKIYKLERAAS
jgi:hypothetical protein